MKKVQVLENKTEYINISKDTKINIKANLDANLVLDITQNAKVVINIEENSHVNLLVLSYLNTDIDINILANLNRYANLNYIGGFLNDQTNLKTVISLNEEYAEAKIDSLIISHKNQDQKAYYEIINNAPLTNGNIYVTGISKNSGKIKVDGIGQINKGMHKSNNQQSLVGLISDEAVIEMNPYLLIDEYDVKAGHGASVGQIDESILYYMMSRGIRRNDAELTYIKGMVKPFLELIFDSKLKENFADVVWGELK